MEQTSSDHQLSRDVFHILSSREVIPYIKKRAPKPPLESEEPLDQLSAAPHSSLTLPEPELDPNSNAVQPEQQRKSQAQKIRESLGKSKRYTVRDESIIHQMKMPIFVSARSSRGLSADVIKKSQLQHTRKLLGTQYHRIQSSTMPVNKVQTQKKE